MKSITSAKGSKRRRVVWLFGFLTLFVIVAVGVQWWLNQPVSLNALDSPPPPDSPFAQVSPGELPGGSVRLRSEPLIEPFRFISDPHRRKIRGFELVYPGPIANTFTGIVYFDMRESIFNPFGDRSFPSNQLAEAHAARFEEVPREELEAGRSSMFRQPELSKTKKLFEVVFVQGENPRQFWFVHDSSSAADHLLWVARKPVESTSSTTVRGYHADLGLRLFGPHTVTDDPVEQPMRLAGYRGLREFGMMQMRVDAGTHNTMIVTLDPNRHGFDVLGDPGGMVTSMGYRPTICDMSPLDQLDPTGLGRRIWRLTPQDGQGGWSPRWGTDDGPVDYFDLVLAPSSNGRHRLLIWQKGRLRNLVHLEDELARRRGLLAKRLQSVPQSEREAVQALHALDSESRVTLEENRVTSLSVTQLASPEGLDRAIRALPALERVTMHGGVLTKKSAELLSKLEHLGALRFSGCRFEEEAFVHFGDLNQLESLDIRQAARFPDEAMNHISKLTNLIALTINRDFYPRPDDWRDLVLSEEGISRVTSLTRLTHLDLHGQNVTDANCGRLSTLSGLTSLALSGEKLTDVGLAALKPLTNLTWLHMWDVAITPEGAESFKRPGLDFEPGPFGRKRD